MVGIPNLTSMPYRDRRGTFCRGWPDKGGGGGGGGGGWVGGGEGVGGGGGGGGGGGCFHLMRRGLWFDVC